MNDCFISRPNSEIWSPAAVDILAGQLGRLRAALLELGVDLLPLIIGIRVIGVRSAVLALPLSTGKQALRRRTSTGIAGLVHTLVIVDIVCTTDTSSWFAWSNYSYHGDGFFGCHQIRPKGRSISGYATDD